MRGFARCSLTGRWRRRWCCMGRFPLSCLWIATARGSFCWPSFRHILDAIREKNPGFLIKTTELIGRFSAAAQRYEAVLKNVQARRNSSLAETRDRAEVCLGPAKRRSVPCCGSAVSRRMMLADRDFQIPLEVPRETYLWLFSLPFSRWPCLRPAQPTRPRSMGGYRIRCAAPSMPAAERPA